MKYKEEYLKEPLGCPFCHKTPISELEAGFDSKDDTQYLIEWECTVCRKMWVEIYKLIDIEEHN